MSERPPFTELVEAPAAGRVFRRPLRPGLADVIGDGRDGRVRLDAIARWLQDIAFVDLVDAGFQGRGAWLVRRTRIRVERFPRFDEKLELATFCSGIGRFSAERRTSVRGGNALVEGVALWVCMDLDGGQPLRLPEDFVAAYAESAAGRRAPVRLRHPDPPEEARSAPWTWRASDLDLAGHVNNSHYWSPLEERLAGMEPERFDAEVEHRSAAQPGPARLLSSGSDLWVTGADGEVHASLLSDA